MVKFYFVVSIIAFIALLHGSTGFTINCKFTTQHFEFHFEQIYLCNVTNCRAFNDERVKIDNATGTHEPSKSLSGVRGLMIKNCKKLHLPPTNVESVFDKLTYISFFGCNLTEIRQSDLKPFAELKYLYLTRNRLEMIENGLFTFNSKLELITLDYNKIFHIHPRTFSHLNELRYLELGNNSCELSPDHGINATSVAAVTNQIEAFQCFSAMKVNEKALEKVVSGINERLRKSDSKYERLTNYLMLGFGCVTLALFVMLIVILLLICAKSGTDEIENDDVSEMNAFPNDAHRKQSEGSFDDDLYETISDVKDNKRVRCTVR